MEKRDEKMGRFALLRENYLIKSPAVLKKITKFYDDVYKIFMTLCKLCFLGMVVVISMVVFNRYIIKSGMSWGEPVALMFMIYMSLISASLAIRKDTHVRMCVIDYLAPQKVISVMRASAHVCIFGFGIFMMVDGWKFSMLARGNVITGVGITSMWQYLSCPIAGIALCLMESERAINWFDRLMRGVTLEGGSLMDEAMELKKEAEENSSDLLEERMKK